MRIGTCWHVRRISHHHVIRGAAQRTGDRAHHGSTRTPAARRWHAPKRTARGQMSNAATLRAAELCGGDGHHSTAGADVENPTAGNVDLHCHRLDQQHRIMLWAYTPSRRQPNPARRDRGWSTSAFRDRSRCEATALSTYMPDYQCVKPQGFANPRTGKLNCHEGFRHRKRAHRRRRSSAASPLLSSRRRAGPWLRRALAPPGEGLPVESGPVVGRISKALGTRVACLMPLGWPGGCTRVRSRPRRGTFCW